MEIVLAIVGKITEYTIAPIGHQLGYLIHYGRNIDDLRAQVDSLRNVRVVVEGHVTAAERNGDIIRPYVKDWIDKANNIVEESERLLDHEVNIGNQRCSLRSCPKYLVSRYKVSRKANKKKMVVAEHFDRRNKWIDPLVSDPAPPPPIRDMYHADAEDLESRKSIINDVLDAIRDDKYNVIGVHGMGGIGKTTLAKEVAKIAEEDKLFEVITPVVAVSQTPSIMKIQHEIAARLGMKLDEKENEEMRAGRLHARILKEKSILVILDDLWAELKLKDIGIPTPSVHHKGCKILLTTRSQQVCNQMGSQRAFPINVLTEGEAWKLFKENAGDDTVDSPNILPIATQVAKECAGLPLAIVLVARALMKRGQSVWEDTLHRLQNHELNSIEVKLHESLKLSYDFLREEDKSCLLLCCLAPEDSEISVIELARWGMGLRLFKNVWKWVEVRNRVRTSIDNLKACSLLLESTRQECVRMHDVVRDFAISIASESKRGIWARIDFGRSEWSDNYLLPLNNNDTTIAVLNNFHHLPAQIDCPKLNLLLLEEFDSSTELPKKLFNQMTELRVLSMVGMSIPEEKGLPWITELRGLEILRISRSSDIFVLPREIGELTRLRILDLSGCKGLRRIPAGVLSRLSQLEGLYMERCFDIKWGEDDSSASLDELKGLSNLSDLHMHLDNHNAQHFPQDIQLPMRLSEFQFHLGRRDYYLFKPNIPKTLVFEGYDAKRIASHQGFKMLLNMAEYLVLQYTEDVECFLSDVKRQGFSKLKRLEVFADITVEYLANYTTKEGGVMILPRPKVFPVLETLDLSCMYNLKEICHGQLPAGSFCELTLLNVHSCRELKKLINICSQNIANGFGQQLHEISISYCHNLEEIFTYDDDIVGVEEETNEIILLPKLRILSLQWTPNLATFCSKKSTPRTILQQHQTIFFPEKIVFSNLNKLVVSGSFEEIWPPQIPGNSFCKLTDLKIGGCDKLKIAIPSNMVQRLRNNLKRLVIRACKMMKEIVANTELGSGANQEGAHHGSSTVLEFPSLVELSIENCPKIETIVARIAEGNLDDTAQVLFNDKIVFSNLNKLVVSGSFEEIWPPQIPSNSFCRLTDLEIGGCDKLKIAIPSNMVQRLRNNLKRFVIRECEMMKEIVANTELGSGANQEGAHHGSSTVLEFPSLEELSIKNCPKIETIVARIAEGNLDDTAQVLFNDKIIFPKLQTLKIINGNFEQIWSPRVEIHMEENFCILRVLEIDGCQKLKKVIPYNLAKSLHALEEMTVKNCALVEEVVHEEVGESVHGEEILFPHLRKVEIDNCGGLRHLFSHSQAKLDFSQLKELEISSCKIMKEILLQESAEEDEEDNASFLRFPQLDSLRLFDLQELTCFYHGNYSLEFPSLKNLTIEKCPKMETVAFDDDVRVNTLLNEKIIFPKLHTLKVSGNFEQIKSPRVVYRMEENFRILRVLILDGCQKLKKAIPYNLAKSLHALEEITVKNCDLVEEVVEEVEESVHGEEILFPHMRKIEIGSCGGLKHLFSHSQAKLYFMKELLLQESAEEEEDDEEDKSSFLRFPQLDSLRLFRLQELTCFYHGHYTLEFPSLKKLTIEECPKMETGAFDDDVMVNSLLNEKVLLPTLDELNIIGLKCVKEIRYRQLPAKSFRQLSILKVSGCDSLRNLLTPSIVKHLSCLRQLEISSCSSLEAVLVDANEEEQRLVLQVSDMQDKDVVFPRVHWLTLESLPNLRSFYSGGLTLEFPSFNYFYLAGCPQMQTFSSGRVVTRLTPKLNDSTKQHLFQEKTKASLPALARLIHSNDEYDLTDACRALSYLSNDNIQAVIESGVCPRLVELLLHESPSVFIPALRTVGNIVTGNDVQTQVIIVHQALPCLLNLLSSDYEKSIKKDACRIISNITAGNRDQIQAVIEAGIIAPLVQLLQNDEFEIKEEAALAISNATSRGINEQIKFLVGQGCIKPLFDLLVCTDPRIVTVCLKGLENILKVGEVEKNLGNTGDVNLYAQLIDEAEGLEKIKNLQMHDNNEIYEKAMKILETYWLKEDELPLGDASQTGFHLGGKKLPVPSCGFNFS